ncbi:helix-turn-helix transcriptional regulator [Carnobacterium sp.]|uniref:helix-turn-helix transcriptional regulator n=1 Tax=Carnobacterium sp. TaxID=48221 RepID=UPI002FC8698B
MKNELTIQREKIGISQKKLGELCGVGQQCVSSWEKGRTVPKPYQMQLLEEFFKVEKEKLFSHDFFKN